MFTDKLLKANIDDYQEIIDLYKQAIIHMNSQGIYQWDFNCYPTKNDLYDDIINDEMLVLKRNVKIVAAVVLNCEQDESYADVEWKFTNCKVGVVHRLCVSPDFQNQGIGRIIMKLSEDYFLEKEIKSIRLDAFSQNPYALKLYKKLGFEKRGEVEFKMGIFYFYEKYIEKEVD